MEVFTHDESREHEAQPGMVYITMPTELGTIYKKRDIETIRQVCTEYELPLFVDGARLGYGLMADDCDFTLPWLCTQCDALYIGGTKVGALCGEAVVFPRNNAPRHFFNIIKQHGALLAKSRLAGVQFDALFTDGLYFNIARHAIDKAMQLRKQFAEAGIPIKDSPTNQQFVVLSKEQIQHLRQTIAFETWEPIDNDNTLCRFVTSWATTDADLDALAKALKSLKP
jgi:threonine aldolase